MNNDDVRRAISVARSDADDSIRSMPPPDIDQLLGLAAAGGPVHAPSARRAARPRPRVLPLSAAAAALIVVAAVLALIVPPERVPDGEPSPQLIALVDSLYAEGSYVIDEIAPRWAAEPQPGYLDSVWSEVLEEVEQNED